MRPCLFCETAVDEKTQFQTSVLTTKDKAINMADLVAGVHPENIEYAVECSGCGANGPLASTKEAAVEAWSKGVAQKR
jgi:hypothetical protein